MEKFSDFIGSIVAGTAIVGSVVIAYKVGRFVQSVNDYYLYDEAETRAEKVEKAENTK